MYRGRLGATEGDFVGMSISFATDVTIDMNGEAVAIKAISQPRLGWWCGTSRSGECGRSIRQRPHRPAARPGPRRKFSDYYGSEWAKNRLDGTTWRSRVAGAA